MLNKKKKEDEEIVERDDRDISGRTCWRAPAEEIVVNSSAQDETRNAQAAAKQ
jgi:hypothetical protein